MSIYFLLQAEGLPAYSQREVHIWFSDSEALCGSVSAHECPESEDGGIAILPPFSTRCWCNARVCEVCHTMWSGGR